MRDPVSASNSIIPKRFGAGIAFAAFLHKNPPIGVAMISTCCKCGVLNLEQELLAATRLPPRFHSSEGLRLSL